ncbi:MAG: glutamate-1-semialdehyde 2,1-aminomutase [Devosiaceae bacterium]|nr:glutamate-1-semialdehyde 2,1-aminomutase [Devosiaceae bacterium]
MSKTISTTKNADLFERSKKVTPGGVHSPVRSFKGLDRPPVFFASAQGATITDVDGNKYIDFCQSFGPLILGHRDSDVEMEVLRAVGDVWSLGAADPYSLELAEWIVEKIPAVESVRFVTSGTEAVMSALRLARGFTGRQKIVKFDGCYHGHVDSMLVKAGSGLAQEGAASSSAGVIGNQVADTIVLPLGDLDALKNLFQNCGSEIAGVIIEPLPANFGLLPLQKSFLEALRALTDEHGALLIFDEVISGFRVALGGMAQVLNIVPDLITYGKIIGGGFPVGAFGGRRQIMEQIAPAGPVYQAGTLSANPISMRAGLTTLKKASAPGKYEQLNDRAKNFADELRTLAKRASFEISVVQNSSLLWLFPGEEKNTPSVPEQFPADLDKRFKPLFLALLEQGIYLAPSGYEVMFLSHAHTDNILEQALGKFDRAFRKLGG